MAIIRKNRSIDPAMPEIGRLYKGEPKTDPKRPGKDVDHFRFEPNERLKQMGSTTGQFASLYDELKAKWDALPIEQKRSISIRFPYWSVDQVFSSNNEIWAKVGGVERCTRRCDGQTCTQWVEERPNPKEPGKMMPVIVRGEADCAASDDDLNCPMGCKPKGRLQFVIPSLYPGLVVWSFTSVIDCSNIEASLAAFREIDLRGIPFRLSRSPQTVNWNKDDGTILPSKKWMCQLEVDPAHGELLLRSQERQRLRELESGITPLLPSSRPMLTASVIDEPQFKRLPDYRSSETWQKIESAMLEAARQGDQAKLQKLGDLAYQRVAEGVLPENAGNGIERLMQQCLEMLVAKAGG